MKLLQPVTLLLASLGASLNALADFTISGKVMDTKGKPVNGATVYLLNSIDGGTSDSLGQFSFSTSEKGAQNLVANIAGTDVMGIPITLTHDTSGIVLIVKKQTPRDLDEVTITAGSFDASNDKTKTVLKPLDIVTTAGANADVVKAMETLPGTQKAGIDNGLLVRGGDASEASVIVDEMVVQNAFFSGPPGVATRSRFGAFSYQGMSFSSGGYSPRYGQALSGVLELNTTDLADKSNLNLGGNMAGIYASGVKKWKNSALEGGFNYTDLSPFYSLATTNFNFFSVPVGGGANARYVWKPNKDGIFKISVNGTFNKSGIGIPNPYAGDTAAASTGNYYSMMGDTIKFYTQSQNVFTTASYKQQFKNKFSLYTAASYSLDDNNNKFGDYPIKQKDQRAQFRLEGKYFINSRTTLLLGGDIQHFGSDKNLGPDTAKYNQKFDETISSAYTELEWTPLYWLAIRPGARFEHSALLNTDKVAPRMSLAIKTSKHTQISLASGVFYQGASNNYYLAGLKPGLQQAIHYIANWQYSANERTLRIEGYYKNYQDLIREPYAAAHFDPNSYRMIFDSTINNSGHGYAQGLELFYRDKKSIKNADFWVSYSYIDTRRLYLNYPYMATPTFIANHNLNLVGKYFVDKWHTSISGTYSFASGYPYFNPEAPVNSNTFLNDRTPVYNNFALSAAYLHSFGRWFSVFFISVDNVFNTHNVFGYRYMYNSQNQSYAKNPVVPALYRTVFIGANFSLTQFSKDEL